MIFGLLVYVSIFSFFLAMQHKQHSVHSGRSFQINSNVPSMPNQNTTKPQISASQPFIKPKDVQASPLLIPTSPRIPTVNKKKSPPESPVVSHNLQNLVLPPICQIPQSRAMQPTSHIPVPKNRTSPSSIPVPIQHPKKSSSIQQDTSNVPHTSNNSIVIGTPQQKQIETPDVTPQTPSPDVTVPMDTSPSPSSSNAKTPGMCCAVINGQMIHYQYVFFVNFMRNKTLSIFIS